jgi:hypothetical protein
MHPPLYGKYEEEKVIDKTSTLSDALEMCIDRSGLANVLEVLALVCEEKAERMDCKLGPDFVIAGAWERTAKELDKVAAKAKARGIK